MKKIIFFSSLILLFIGFSLYPLRSLIFSNTFTEKSLFVFTNEAESRPCGGFITAFGEGTVFPPSFEIRNSYELNSFDFGENEYPLSLISKRKKFWDLAFNPNIESCSEGILDAYNKYFNTQFTTVFLVNFSIINDLQKLLGIQKSQDFFDFLSREVANVDRHDEQILSERKSILKNISNSLVQRGIFSFWKWRTISRYISDAFQNGNIFVSGVSPEISLRANDFSVLEWNLGGGKSSRLLKKVFHLSFRETSPQEWNINGRLDVRNLSGFDEPIGQYWKGVFEIKIPEIFSIQSSQKSSILQKNTFLIETEIAPGKDFVYYFSFSYSGNIEDISFFRPRGQNIFLDVDVSVYPQQILTNLVSLEGKSNTASFFGNIINQRKKFSWDFQEDTLSPFITFHEKVLYENIPKDLQKEFSPDDFLVEIHFNEKVNLSSLFSVKLLDRQYRKKDIKEDLYMLRYRESENKTAVFLSFHQNEPQKNERYYLQVKGVQDVFGNTLQKTKNTIIEK